eukprot:CAMPEP_0194145184 /NCGR_PEP_ID=MMETSP0152-20130528/15616_1 /TAXON_ID=1049557 /ORGANISM="Thalassiothrix antarctica, Strain L6-D1" /LENGTH=244 /DNA_ID=CAMNT_0038845293 /DNA_START=102 /DNA_END=836 /DNA_ORIENTATION=-
MKIVSLTALITASAASAFVQTSTPRPVSSIVVNGRPVPDAEIIEPPKPPPVKKMSISLPFMEQPKLLDGTLPGDVGFDPLELAGETKEDLIKMREAEIKHGRLAMLAAVGWPAAELWDGALAKSIGAPTLLVGKGVSPSFLNGGLDKVDQWFWAMLIALSGWIEFENKIQKEDVKKEKYEPGDCNFDLLKLLPEDPAARKDMYTKELKHGRIAMMAVLGYTVQEAIYRVPVIEQSPWFFKPLFS